MAAAERLILIHKMKLSLTKHNFRLINNNDVHGRSTRRNDDIHVFYPYAARSYANAAIMRATNEYNSLPNHIKELTSLVNFKMRVKLLVMERSENYSVMSPFCHIN